jgi:hypothetical protein
MLQGSITEADAAFVETWENIASITNYVIRLDVRGDEKFEGISGKRTFMITTRERLITQDKVEDVKNDPFQNGSFRPVVVPDSVNIETNPNALSDDEIKSIFISSDIAWGEWMKTLDAPATLRRMIDMADEADISLKRFRELQKRHEELNPKRRITQKDREQFESLAPNAAQGTGEPTGRKPRMGNG